MRYLALLRGVNVGGKSLISMKELVDVLSQNDFSDVKSYINSGNIILISNLKHNEVAPKIEKIIKQNFNLDVMVLVKDQQDIESILSKVPDIFLNDEVQKTDVMFLGAKYENPDVIFSLKYDTKIEALYYITGALVWNIKRKNYSKSKIPKMIGTDLYKNMTTRNINTVRKLLALL